MLHQQTGRPYSESQREREQDHDITRRQYGSERGQYGPRSQYGQPYEQGDWHGDPHAAERGAYSYGGRTDGPRRHDDDYERHTSRAYSSDSSRLHGEGVEGYRPGYSHRAGSGGYLQPQPSYGSRNFDGGPGGSWANDAPGGWQAGSMGHGTYGPDRDRYDGAGGGAASYGRSATADPRYRSGPKGYKRSDDRLKEDICERLMHDSRIDASEVSVEVKEGKVSLTGDVPERRMKHAVEDVVDCCSGVCDIDNRLRVAAGTGHDDKDRESKSTAGGSSSSQSSSSQSSGQRKA